MVLNASITHQYRASAGSVGRTVTCRPGTPARLTMALLHIGCLSLPHRCSPAYRLPFAQPASATWPPLAPTDHATRRSRQCAAPRPSVRPCFPYRITGGCVTVVLCPAGCCHVCSSRRPGSCVAPALRIVCEPPASEWDRHHRRPPSRPPIRGNTLRRGSGCHAVFILIPLTSTMVALASAWTPSPTPTRCPFLQLPPCVPRRAIPATQNRDRPGRAWSFGATCARPAASEARLCCQTALPVKLASAKTDTTDGVRDILPL